MWVNISVLAFYFYFHPLDSPPLAPSFAHSFHHHLLSNRECFHSTSSSSSGNRYDTRFSILWDLLFLFFFFSSADRRQSRKAVSSVRKSKTKSCITTTATSTDWFMFFSAAEKHTHTHTHLNRYLRVQAKEKEKKRECIKQKRDTSRRLRVLLEWKWMSWVSEWIAKKKQEQERQCQLSIVGIRRRRRKRKKESVCVRALCSAHLINRVAVASNRIHICRRRRPDQLPSLSLSLLFPFPNELNILMGRGRRRIPAEFYTLPTD